MIATVQRTAAAHFPRLRGTRVLVAASGGADSTALALMLKEMGCSIVLAHVHHGIRGAAADADARFVRRLARKLGVPFVLGRFDVPAEARARGESLEMAARRVRRAFLIETARREGIRRIAVGHTADDQAETVLMRIVRGTSVTGLAGIPHVTRHGGAVFIRPLRDATRRQVLDYLARRRQSFREDETNADDFARRNRVRHEILPLLEKRLNPAVRQALLRLADIAAAEDEVLSGLARRARREGRMAAPPLAIRRRLALDEMRRAGIPPGKQDFHAVENRRKKFPWRGKSGIGAGVAHPDGPGIFAAAGRGVPVRGGGGGARSGVPQLAGGRPDGAAGHDGKQKALRCVHRSESAARGAERLGGG